MVIKMPIDLPVFQPQVQGGSITQIKPHDDFSESVMKGYQVGRIIAGIPQQEDALKLERMRQQLFQSRESFPLEQQLLRDKHGNVPYERSKVVQDILESPGAVSGMSTGPVVPIGNSPFAKTMQFAAPEGNGQVPSDTVQMDIPGQDIGISPSRMQEYLKERVNRKGYSGKAILAGHDVVDMVQVVMQPDGTFWKNGQPFYGKITKQYAPKLYGQIDERALEWNPSTEEIYYQDDRTSPSTEEMKRFVKLGGPTLSFQTDPSGKMFGFPTTGPTKGQGTPATVASGEAPPEPTVENPNPAEPQKPFTKSTPQSEKIQGELRNLKDARAFTGLMHDLYNKVKKQGNVGMISGNVTKAMNFVSGGAYDPNAATYNTNRDAFAASLRGLTGDDSRFSDADREALKGVLAKIEKNEEVGETQWALVNGILDKREKIRWEDEKLGKKETTTEMSIKEPPKKGTREIKDPEFGTIKISR